MANEVFQKLYNELNTRQKEAVDTIDGPVMVVAGPGTGKTRVLTMRIANILIKNKAKPEEILALTFTESGVAAMRKQLVEILGPKAYYVSIYTFHAFCNDLIRGNIDEFPQFYEKNLIDEIGQMQILEDVINRGNFKLLKPFGDNFMYVQPLLRSFSDLKREGIGPEKLNETLRSASEEFLNIEDLYHEKGPHKGKMKGKYQDLERNIEKNKELVVAYKAYQEKLREIGYDYDEIILSVVERLDSDEVFSQKLQEQYKYLLADEHQDTNYAQNRVLELLSDKAGAQNIFVVGDEKQSIYRFQGANIQNFIYFHSKYPKAKIITLSDNYRSTQSILDASGSLISKDVLLKACAGHAEKKIRVYNFRDQDSENYFLARKIKQLTKNGAKPNEIAVLYRDNRDAFSIQEMLQKNKISCRVESDEQILENKDIKNFVTMLKAVVDFGSGDFFAAVLHVNFLKVPSIDIYKFLQRSPYSSTRVWKIHKLLSRWNKLAYNMSAPQIFERIVRESGFLDYLLKKQDYIERINRLRALHNLVKKLASQDKNYTLGDFVAHIELIGDRGVSLWDKKLDINKNAVRLTTAHRSKGLEFDYVFITGANMGHWGKRHTRQMIKLPHGVFPGAGLSPRFPSGAGNAPLGGSRLALTTSSEINPLLETDSESDERRLFYVALTRARKQVYISYPRMNIDGRELFPSQFIEEISGDYKIAGTGGVYEKNLENNPKIIFAAQKNIIAADDEKEFLKELFEKRGLSPTALNNYLECPWKYFYNNLLQIPRAKTKHEMYGTAVHAALKELFDTQKQDLTLLLESFERALIREPISEHDYTESLAKGKETLLKYYENYNGTWHTNTVNEFVVKNVFLDGEVRLTGKIDKIEMLEGNKVNVVDYKTGKRRTRNELEGKTKNTTGNEKRQLVFYKLLLDKLEGSPYVMTSGEIDFVEPDKNSGKFFKEKFEITQDDVRELEYKIQDVTAEMLGFSFWNERCGNSSCDYCKLRDIMV